MTHTVFYAWQSDLPANLNRNLIGRAAKDAVKRIISDPDLAFEPRIDQDTAGVPGSPDIAQTILDKVDAAAVFLCDVSIINDYVEDGVRPTPNPNVMIELGYAVRSIGWSRVIMVLNSSAAEVEELPFDIRHRRPLIYRATEESNKSEVQRQLSIDLELAIRACLVVLPEDESEDTVAERDALIAIEEQRPTRKLAIEQFCQLILNRIDTMAPNFSGRSNWAKMRIKEGDRLSRAHKLVESLEASLSPLASFARVADTAARANDRDAISELYRSLESLVERYFPSPGSGPYGDDDTDFYVFMGHDFMLCLVSGILRARAWGLLDVVLRENLFIRSAEDGGGSYVAFDFIAQATDLFKPLNQSQGRISSRADTISSLHKQDPLASIVSVQEAMEADLFLYYAGGNYEPGDLKAGWWPYGLLYLKTRPAFLTHARQPEVALAIARAFGLSSIDDLNSRINERAETVNKMFQGRIRASGMFDLSLN